MKKYLLVILVFTVSLGVFSNENKKWKEQYGANGIYRHDDDDKGSWKHHSKGKHGKYDSKPAKNIPARVAEAFYNDYPYAKNTAWTKHKGYWTVAFNNGIHRSTATYHANGDRRDARVGGQTPPIITQPYPYPRNQGGVYGQPKTVDPKDYGGVKTTPTPTQTPTPSGKPDPKDYGGVK